MSKPVNNFDSTTSTIVLALSQREPACSLLVNGNGPRPNPEEFLRRMEACRLRWREVQATKPPDL